MTSQARIDANRRNAQKSTGPRTPEGRARSAQNARKHGLAAHRSDPELVARLEASQRPDACGAHARRAIAAWALATAHYLRIQTAAVRLFDSCLRAATPRPISRRAADRRRRQGWRQLVHLAGPSAEELEDAEAAQRLMEASRDIRLAFDRDDALAAFQKGNLLRALDRAERRALSRMRRADLHMIEAIERDAMAFNRCVHRQEPTFASDTKPGASAKSAASERPTAARALPDIDVGRTSDNFDPHIPSGSAAIGGRSGAATTKDTRGDRLFGANKATGAGFEIAPVGPARSAANISTHDLRGCRPPARADARKSDRANDLTLAPNEAKGDGRKTGATEPNEANWLVGNIAASRPVGATFRPSGRSRTREQSG